MPRDDFDRRRLRSLYERNRSRVSALADARDRRRGGDDSYAAPRRYVVSERRTRIEGFGRGGAQVRRVERRVLRVRDAPRPRRFSDRGIFRRGGRDRFRRADDEDRKERRDRFREDSERRREGGGVRRFGEARRQRLRMRSRRGGLDNRREIEDLRQRGSRRGGEDRGKNNSNNNNRGGNNNSNKNRGGNSNHNNNNRGNNNNNNNVSRGNNNNNSSNRAGNNAKNKSGGKSNQPRRTREQPLTHEQLDRQLESYHN
ncbi:hypothetical protein ABL78_1138 [Leptomonas seymouri]|uniref:Chromatin target of PRMT1 protein C-terminal domain-containing protein n=1 Tax=Leptomonas seymouri TaxID=5684 RepID=A0A0N1IB26_LEPSE|nr:hypothetical protein ABL78_1138 [Leptomonas seymouri]|eukprot:KPI89758.1 hypothetical protein ABL78_1138 [Leptomonas seymouri]